MAAKTKWVSIRFLQGIDTETDPKALTIGTPTGIENGVYPKPGTVEKRHGERRLNRRLITKDGSYQQISGCLALSSRADERDLFMLTPDSKVVSYDDLEDAWVTRGDWVNLSTQIKPLPRGASERWDGTFARIGDTWLVGWQDATGGVRAQWFDNDLRSFGADFRVGGSSGRSPKALTVDDHVHVYFLSGTDLHVAVMDPARPTSQNYTLNLLLSGITASLPNGACPYDAASHPSINRSFVAASIPGSTYLMQVRRNGVIATSGSSQPAPNPILAPRSQVGPALAISHDAAVIGLGYKDDPEGDGSGFPRSYVVDSWYTDSFGPYGSTLIDESGVVSGSDSSICRHTIVYASGTRRSSGNSTPTYTTHVYMEMSATLETDRYIRFGGAIGPDQLTKGVFRHHSRLGSKAFTVDKSSYVWLNRPSRVQSTDYLYRNDGLPTGRSRPGFSTANVSGTLSDTVVIPGEQPLVIRPITNRDQLNAVDGSGSQFGGRHIRLSQTTFGMSPTAVDVAGVSVIPGGWLGTYDGSNVVELGFGELIDSLSGSTSPAAGTGTLTNAQFLYAVVPQYFDAQGNRYLGDCYQPLQMTRQSGSIGTSNTASLTWPNIVHTVKDGTRAANITYCVYRTGPNGTLLQRIDDPAKPIINDINQDYTTWTDSVTEAARAFGEPLYTAGELSNVMPSSGRLLAAGGDRLYVAGFEDDDNFIAGSKLCNGGAIAFADGEGFDVDATGGPITAIANNRQGGLAIFKRNSILGTALVGPDNSVAIGGDWPEVIGITSDVGCDAESAVFAVAGRTEQGLVFESERGIRLLERTATVKDVGWPARAYDDLTVVGGLGPRLSEEARVYTEEGTTLVFNTRTDCWSTFPGQPTVATALWNGAPVRGASDGFCYVEDPTSYRDGDFTYPLTLTLGWMSFVGLQGMQRVRRLLLIGDLKSDHKLRVEAQYDFRDSWSLVGEMDTSAAIGAQPYGEGGYGEGFYGGSDPVYQLEFTTPRQRMQALRLRISDVSIGGTGAGFSLTEMKIEVAPENDRPSLPSRKRR